MSKKGIFLVIAACFIVLGASFGITYAYLIANDSKVNEFVVGENTIEVVEKFEPPEELNPGTSFVKEPRVENTGNLPCFVRMRADFSDSAAADFCRPLEIDEEKWDLRSDGYYYYKELLEPGTATDPLFKTVTVKSEAEGVSEGDMIDFDILIYAESCQHTDHIGDCPDSEYYDIWRR